MSTAMIITRGMLIVLFGVGFLLSYAYSACDCVVNCKKLEGFGYKDNVANALICMKNDPFNAVEDLQRYTCIWET